MEKLAGAVILYNPDIGLWKRILTYLPHLERLYILDNSPKSNKHLFPNDLEFSKCQYILNNENLGISEPLNIACERAIQDGFNWLLTMDQDSFYNDQSFIQYMNCIQNFENRNNVGMFGSQYNLVNPDFLKCQFNEVEHLITSGSILNLAVFSQIGPFDKNLYIDGVDQEYSFRIIINNYKVIRFENISFQHELGSNQSFRSLKNG
ncbi:MAG: glycosyl transferase, partial [Pseudopedobacter saltans]